MVKATKLKQTFYVNDNPPVMRTVTVPMPLNKAVKMLENELPAPSKFFADLKKDKEASFVFKSQRHGISGTTEEITRVVVEVLEFDLEGETIRELNEEAKPMTVLKRALNLFKGI